MQRWAELGYKPATDRKLFVFRNAMIAYQGSKYSPVIGYFRHENENRRQFETLKS